MQALKSIAYRGGLVTFRIPSTWCEEYEPDGGGTFYQQGGDSTLRLNVLTMTSKDDLSEDSAVNAVARPTDNRQIRKLRNGNAVARYVHTATEEGRELEIHYWELAGPLPPRHMRLAIFSFTIPASKSKDGVVLNELELIDSSISAAEFAKVHGVTGSPLKKPWWPFW